EHQRRRGVPAPGRRRIRGDINEYADLGGDTQNVVKQVGVGGHQQRVTGRLGCAELDGAGSHRGLRYGLCGSDWHTVDHRRALVRAHRWLLWTTRVDVDNGPGGSRPWSPSGNFRTQDSAQVIVNPPSNEPVDTTPLF